MSEHIKQNRVVPLDKLMPHPRNYRGHPESQVQRLVTSLGRFGQGRSIVVQDGPQGYLIVAGHGVVEAARHLRYAELRADILPVEWTPAQVEGYLVADNLHGEGGEDDQEMLAQILQEQQDAGFDLASLGTDEEALRQMLEELGDDYLGDSGDDEEVAEKGGEESGSLLALLDITIADPKHEVHNGDIWQLGEHTLICAHVFKDWKIWITYLKDDLTLFLPFAGPMVPLSKKANDHLLVMVQPDTYIAGHIIDRFTDVYGPSSVKKIDHVFASIEEEEETPQEDEGDE